jgi:hypothetical protein
MVPFGLGARRRQELVASRMVAVADERMKRR